MGVELWWEDTASGNPKYSGKKPFPVPFIFTSDITWTDLGSNPEEEGG